MIVLRSLVKTKIKITDDLDLSKIDGFEKVKCAVRYRWKNSRFKKSMDEKNDNKALELLMKRKEELKGVLLYQFRSTLVNNSKVKMVTISVDRCYDEILDDTLNMTDFIGYEIRRIKEDSDYLLAFPDLPILLEVKKKV